MPLMAAPRSVLAHNSSSPAWGSKGMVEKEQPQQQKQHNNAISMLHFFSPFNLSSFPLRALRRLARAFNSLPAMAPASFHLQALRMGFPAAKLKEGEGEDGGGVVGGGRSVSQPRLPIMWFPRFGRSVKEINEVQTRRDLAVNRTTVDQETERKVAPFMNSRGQTLFTQSWTPTNPETTLKCKDEYKDSQGRMTIEGLGSSGIWSNACPNYSKWGLVILLHGLNEHSGRYAEFAINLNSQGYGVFGMDWIGHGGSDGLHGYVESLDHVVADLQEYLRRVTFEYPGLPCFLFGHSTGGAIVLKATSQLDLEIKLQGVILTSPAVRVKPAHPVIGAVAPLFSVLLPRYQFRGANRKLAVCRDPTSLVTKYTDPLVYTGPIRVRTGTEILRLSYYLLKNLKTITVPFLVLHGSDDQVTDPKGSQELYDQASSMHKDIKLYTGLLHDILFEPERFEITKDILKWMNERLG